MHPIPTSFLALLVITTPLQALASDPIVGQLEISAGKAGLPAGVITSLNRFGRALAPAGDFDGDGVPDIVVGVPAWVGALGVEGAVDMLFLNTDGTVKDHRLIKRSTFELPGGDPRFGSSIAPLGDLDGDGVLDLAIGQPHGNDILSSFPFDPRGVVRIVFLNADGTVKGHQTIADGTYTGKLGGFAGTIGDDDAFGSALAPLGDLDGDGVIDLAVGASSVNEFGVPAGTGDGAVWILFLNADGSVKSETKIDKLQVPLAGFDGFGMALAALGDDDGDGEIELAVGLPEDDDGGPSQGAVWILTLDATGGPTSSQKLSSLTGVTGLLGAARFGQGLGALGDWNNDGISDLAVGAPSMTIGSERTGAVWLITRDGAGAIQTQAVVAEGQGGFTGSLDESDAFGSAVVRLGDVDGDGKDDLAVGARSGGIPAGPGLGGGASWILFADPPPPPYFVNLGKSLKGTPFLPPETIGTGILKAGFGLNIILRNALPAAPASLVVGYSSLTAPFKGGTMVPDPATILGGFNTGPTGVVTIGAAWPAGIPAGFNFTLQWWIADAGGPAGFSASNGLKGIAQ